MTKIGDKNKFAIELSFDDFYNDDWVAFGSFRMFLNGFAYGLKGRGTTYFYLIVVELRKLIEENIMKKNFFSGYSDKEIIDGYLTTFQLTEEERKGKSFLGLDFNHLVDSFYDFREHTEMAFNDGSCVLMFRDESKVKLLGFKNPFGNKIRNLNSVDISREEFDRIIKNTLDTILAERAKAIKNGTAIINYE